MEYIYMAYMNYIGSDSVFHYPSPRRYATKAEAKRESRKEMLSCIREVYGKDYDFDAHPKWDGDSFKYCDEDHDFCITAAKI